MTRVLPHATAAALLAAVLGSTSIPLASAAAPAAAPADVRTHGVRAAPTFSQPSQVHVDAGGNTYVYDHGARQVTRTDPSGATTVVVGNGDEGTMVAGRATETPLGWIEDMDVARDGTLYLADHTSFAVARVTTDGALSIIPGATQGTPSGVGVDAAGNVYVADCGTHAVRKVAPDGSVTTILDRSSDVAGWRHVFHPETIEVTPDGTVFVEDTGNYVLDRIAPDGSVSVFAGTGEEWTTPQPGPATQTTVYVGSMAADDDGTLYFVGTTQGLGRISPDGVLSVLAVPDGDDWSRQPWGIGIDSGQLIASHRDEPLRRYRLADLREYDPAGPGGGGPSFPELGYSWHPTVKAGRPVRMRVHLSTGEGPATGTVELTAGRRSSGPRELVDGSAVLRVRHPWRRGVHDVRLDYSGDGRTMAAQFTFEVTVARH